MQTKRSKRYQAIPWTTYLKRNYQLYLFLVPGLLYIFLFCILPMVGIIIAFEDYSLFAADSPFLAMFHSEWVGLAHFSRLLSRPEFHNAFKNTIVISLLKLFINFPAPIVFAGFPKLCSWWHICPISFPGRSSAA